MTILFRIFQRNTINLIDLYNSLLLFSISNVHNMEYGDLVVNFYILRPLKMITKGYTDFVQMYDTGRRRRGKHHKVYMYKYSCAGID